MIRDSQSSGYCIRKVASALRKRSEAIVGPVFRDMTLGAIGGGLVGGMAPASGSTREVADANRGMHAVLGAGLGATAGGLAHLIDYYRDHPKPATPPAQTVPLDFKNIENMSEEEIQEALRRIVEQDPNQPDKRSLV